MKTLVNIILIFCWFNSFSQNTNSFFNVKNQPYSYKEKESNDLLLDSTSHFFISPKLFFITSNNQKIDNSTVFLYGGSLSGNFKNKLKFIGSVESISGKYNLPLQNYIDSLHVYPGKSRILEDGHMYNFRVNYTFFKYFNLSTGKSTHFIGNGYRSLLLSNEASPYLFVLLKTSIWKINYYNLYATFLDIQDSEINRKKHSTIHYLDFLATENISFGIFESVIWQSRDETYNRGYDIEYLNPVIFYRPVEFSKGSPDNVLMGFNANIKYKNSSLYGQFILDDLNISRASDGEDDAVSGNESGFFQNKFGFQIGIKLEDPFKFPITILTEFNQVQPYTYAHKTTMQNYTHFNQALAHPVGANFKEGIFLAKYKYKKWETLFKYTYLVYGRDTTNSHYGQNIFLSDFEAEREGEQFSFGNFNGQGVKTKLHNMYSEISYSLNNLQLFFALTYRDEKIPVLNQDRTDWWIGFGVRTEFFNPFIDY